MRVARLKEPVEGHKCATVLRAFEVHCQCGWVSLPHRERRYAYSEWRDHVAGHGGEIVWKDETL
jgi:hypothetical protein